ncbi:MAG: substrate-binding domain-containing protein [Xanthomonadales bacterium]|nr:substrate-binding domain-containing protein [Xanthomonadales bacterium]
MNPRILSFLAACLCVLLSASPAWAQLVLRGDYVAARGITELGSLYAKERGTSVAVTPFSTNSGIDGVLSGEIDLAASARSPIAVRPAEMGLVFHPVAWDALVFIVHPSNPVSNLSLTQVRDIFQGKLDNWNQVGGKDAPIDLYSVMGPYDGLESTIRQMLFGDPGYRAMIDRLFLNQHQIEVGIQMDPDAIGMTTLAGLSRQKVKSLSIEGVTANRDSVGDGRYLLSLPLFMVYKADGPKADKIADFADFLETPVAQNVLLGKQLVPHRDDEEFRNIHMQRVATMWERLGGEPMSQAQARALARSLDDGADTDAATPAVAEAGAGAVTADPAAAQAAATVPAVLAEAPAVATAANGAVAGNEASAVPAVAEVPAGAPEPAGLAVAGASLEGDTDVVADGAAGTAAIANAAANADAVAQTTAGNAAVADAAASPAADGGPDTAQAAATAPATLAEQDDALDQDAEADTECKKRLFSRTC